MENADQARELHERFAIELFNLVWDLMDREVRTPEEDDRMLHAAHASRFHWGEIGTPLEFERGEWQISRVYSVLVSEYSKINITAVHLFQIDIICAMVSGWKVFEQKNIEEAAQKRITFDVVFQGTSFISQFFLYAADENRCHFLHSLA